MIGSRCRYICNTFIISASKEYQCYIQRKAILSPNALPKSGKRLKSTELAMVERSIIRKDAANSCINEFKIVFLDSGMDS